MKLLVKIKDWFFKRRNNFVMEKNTFPVNTIIDNNYLMVNNIGLDYSSQLEAKMAIFSKIEKFYKNNRDIIVLRHFYPEFAIVIVDPIGFYKGELTLFGNSAATISRFIGNHGQDAIKFKTALNEKIFYKYGFYNSIEKISFKILKDNIESN